MAFITSVMTATATAPKQLTGADLLEFIRVNPSMPRNELALETGYFRVATSKDGTPSKRPQVEHLLAAITSAKGIELAPASAGATRCTGLLKATKIGSVPISRHYLAQIGVGPTDRVRVSRADDGPYLIVESA
jgi:phospholipase C